MQAIDKDTIQDEIPSKVKLGSGSFYLFYKNRYTLLKGCREITLLGLKQMPLINEE